MPSKEDADRVLRARQGRKACYPCASRKIKCTGVYPCAACLRRGHPEICIANSPSEPAGRRRSPARSRPRQLGRHGSARSSPHSPSGLVDEFLPGPEGSTAMTSESVQGSSNTTQVLHNGFCQDSAEEPKDSAPPSFIGENSTPSFVHGASFAGNENFEREVRPALGLQNTLNAYPFMKRQSVNDLTILLNQMIPSHADILKYSQSYQNTFHHFYPLVADSEEFEALICSFLERTSARECSQRTVFDSPLTQLDILETGLLLAILACGAQFSDNPTSSRVLSSRDLVRRSFHCARLSNFLLRPTLHTIQTLLILGHVLQNDGQADAAWALLGTTTRLAQSLGLHSNSYDNVATEKERLKRKKIWATVLWQDCILSLCFDRPSISAAPHSLFPRTESNLSYLGCMYELTELGRDILSKPQSERTSTGFSLHYLSLVDSIRAKGAPYIQNLCHCRSRQEKMEHHAVRLQLSFCAAIVCRPALKSAPQLGEEAQHALVKGKATESLVNTIRAFLDLQSLTVLPLRSWSMIHAALSSAMLLELFDGHGNHEEIRDLEMRFISVLSREQPVTSSSSDSDSSLLLSSSHLRALRALQNTISRRPNSQRRNSAAASAPEQNQSSHGHRDASLELAATIPEASEKSILHQPLTEQYTGGEVLGDFPMDMLGNFDWSQYSLSGPFGYDDSFDQFDLGI